MYKGRPRPILSSLYIVMGIVNEEESNIPLNAMDSFSHTLQRDPPPYAYTPLTPQTESSPSSPIIASKTVLAPPPSDGPHFSSTSVTPAPATPLRVLDSQDPLSTCDTRFADIVLKHIILPRLRVGVLRWKDRETFEYVPQTKEDVYSDVKRHSLTFRKNNAFDDQSTMKSWVLLLRNIDSDFMPLNRL